MKPRVILAGVLAALSLLPENGATQTWFTNEHLDLNILYDGATSNFTMEVRDEDSGGTDYAPGDAVLLVPTNALLTVPPLPAFSFLGNPGDPVWILPQSQDFDLLYLGVAAYGVSGGLFTGNQVSVALTGVSNARGGHFALYSSDIFGNPVVGMNSRDGITASDSIVVGAGGHLHFNWAFSAPGLYEVELRAFGTLTDLTAITGAPAAFRFFVIPEPQTVALLGLGAALLAFRRRGMGAHTRRG